MARIRYRKTFVLGTSESVQRFNHPENGARYKVIINRETNEWSIVDDYSGLMALTGQHKSAHKAKIQIRKALDSLGVKVDVEVRKKRLAA